MLKDKNLQMMANIGELIVVVASTLWITHEALVPYLFALGAMLFVPSRLMLGQPKASPIWLTLATILIFFRQPTFVDFDGGFYIMPSWWLAAFIGFAVNEVYYAFRKP